MKRPRDATERYLPLAYFGVSVVALVLVLPTVLRPPDDRPPPSAQFSPDDPEDAPETIVTTLGRAASATAGAGLDGGALAAVEPGQRTAAARPARARTASGPHRGRRPRCTRRRARLRGQATTGARRGRA